MIVRYILFMFIHFMCDIFVYVKVVHLIGSLSSLQPCTRSLRELNMSCNRCGDNGLFMLKLGLLANRSLEKLHLSQVKMTDEGLTQVHAFILVYTHIH